MLGRVVPIDRMTLEPTGGVLASYADVLAHYRANAADGVALLAGTQPDGSTLVVVRADTPETYRAWLHEACTERVERRDDDEDPDRGQSVAVPRYRQLTFKTHKLGRGVDLVADGPVPAHVVREDGWTFSISATPQANEMPDWLVQALGGQLAKTAKSTTAGSSTGRP